MAKSYLPLAVVAGTLVLAAGCRGDDSVASRSALAFRQAQQRGETFGGDGHAHGHGALTQDEVPGTDEHAEMGQDAGRSTGQPMDHGAMGHGEDQSASAGERVDHAAMGHEARPGAGQDSPKPTDHAAMGHGHEASSPPPGKAMDHSATGQVSPVGGQPTSPGAVPAGTAILPAAPVPPDATAATLAPDALDAPATTSIVEASRAAATASEMGGAGGHGGHGGAGTYRHVDAGRDGDARDPQREAPAGGPPPSAHESHESGAGVPQRSPKVVYACPLHPEVLREEPGTCPICGTQLVRREEE